MNSDSQLISVGIDVGTSTTQLIFSQITFKNQSGIFTVPNIEISDKKLLYQSQIYFTPLINEEIIDFNKIVEIVDKEYLKSGFNKNDIDIGAVIITGESARKHNSNEVVKLLSEYAGDFVVASAGVDLESVIAAKGAGADIYSKDHHQSVVHIDIGGGTSNYCLIKQGDISDTGCFDIGGRLIKLNDNQEIYHLTTKAKTIIERHNLNLKINQKANVSELEKFCDILTKVIEASLGLRNKDEDFDLLVTNKSIDISSKIDSISFSGGVSEYIYNIKNENDLFKFNDIGILLANSIKKSELLKTIQCNEVLQTLQATVVGAGMHTTKVSGSTIYCDASNLPIKNISVIKLSENETKDISKIAKIIEKRVKWYEIKDDSEYIAIALAGQSFYSFEDVSNLANQIIEGLKSYLNYNSTLIVILENDYAKALGFSIRSQVNKDIEIICLDGIIVNQGDYIDIGMPLVSNQVLPVIVKTIVFN